MVIRSGGVGSEGLRRRAVMNRIKYPRSFHLPWSQGATDDDKTLTSTDHFDGQDVVVTEKMDGENTTVYPDGYVHARSVSGRPHDSQTWVRSFAQQWAHELPSTFRVCGENVYAKHSISYGALDTYFYVFGIFDGGKSLSWDEVVAYSEMLGLQTVPVLYRGPWDAKAVQRCYTGVSRCGGVQEGYVVRLTDSFLLSQYPTSLAKFVRAGHVAEGAAHWRSTAVVPNKLRRL